MLRTGSPRRTCRFGCGTSRVWTTIRFRIPRSMHRRHWSIEAQATTGSGPSASFLGSDMRAAYYGGSSHRHRPVARACSSIDGTDLADLNTYYTNAGQTNNVPITLCPRTGPAPVAWTSSGCDDTEQTLDMTQALGMAPGLSSLVMYVGSTDSAIFNAMATASPLNAQLSSSWTWSPADPSTDNPYFEEFAAQGQNLFQAAGRQRHLERRVRLPRSARRTMCISLRSAART